LRRLAGSDWGAGVTALRTVTLASPFNCRVLRFCEVTQYSHPPHWACH